MGSKYVRDTAAAKKISVYVVIDEKGKHVGTVQIHHGDGRTLVNVWDHTDENASGPQVGTANGYGYDRETAALAGLKIAGYEMVDHSTPAHKAYENFPAGPYKRNSEHTRMIEAALPDVTLCNYDQGQDAYTSAYVEPGLRRLRARGFRVICGI